MQDDVMLQKKMLLLMCFCCSWSYFCFVIGSAQR